jgi:LPS-assembly protein
LASGVLAFSAGSMCLLQVSHAADNAISFEADNVVVDQNDNSLLATGNVLLKQANETLRANEVRYYRPKNRAVARGNVVHTAADGTISYAEVMEIETEFSHIIAETIVAQFADGSWISAEHADRKTEQLEVFDQTRYTPCKCNFRNGERPLWGINATQTVRNEKNQTVTHFNMRMHVLNVPVVYLPLLSHPDWTVRRRSGFLTPSFIVSSDLGFTPSVPYYHIIDETSDIELTPYKYQYRGLGAKIRYRRLWDNATFNSDFYTGNVETFKKNRELVGAVDASFSSPIGNGWNFNARLRRTSQDTFMRRYDFNDDTSLKSSITASRVDKNRYYLVEASDRQSLYAAEKDFNEPTILPHIFYEKTQKGWREEQQVRTELSAIQLDNDRGHDLARWTGLLEVSEDFRIPYGIASYEANITGYYYTIHKKPSTATTRLGDIKFVNPAFSLGLRFPFLMSTSNLKAIIEPRVKLSYIGGADNTDKIPNRDASDYRIDEANLFLLNPYQGKDYVLPGSRVDVGSSVTSDGGLLGQVNGFVGISRRLSGEASNGLNTGQGKSYSDFVSSLSIKPLENLYLRWTGRISSTDLNLNESTTTITSSLGNGDLSVTHTQLAKAYFSNSNDDREELSASYSQALPLGWNLSASQIWDLSYGNRTKKQTSLALVWNGGEQDCMQMTFSYSTDASTDRDIEPINQVSMTISFKNLGAISQNLGAMINSGRRSLINY